MQLNHKPGEHIEVNWAGDPAYITVPFLPIIDE